MEEFSQSRGDDDLFDDEIIPLEDTPQIEDVTTQLQQTALRTIPVAPRGHISEDSSFRGSRGRGRGGPARGAQKNSLLNSKYAPQAPPEPAPLAEASAAAVAIPSETIDAPASAEEDDTLTKTTSNTTAPAQPSPSKPLAVRGDRTATGGIKKAKLTEEELNTKLAAAKERSQNRSAAHARAQADAASFEQRERVAQEKRAKDVMNRKVMDNEREKNRARKMAVMGGREWDAEKNEEDFRITSGGRGRGGHRGGPLMRGVNAMVHDAREDDLSQYEWHEDRGRGRGNRGRAGRGGRGGRGGREQRPDLFEQPNPETDFPALPSSAKPRNGAPPRPKEESPASSRPLPTRTDSDALSPSGEKGTWADQMENEAAKVL